MRGDELRTSRASTRESGEAAHHDSSQLRAAIAASAALISRLTQSISLSFFMGRTRTVFEAGFALKTHGSLVKGLTPLRALVAGLFFSFMLSIPASLKEPDFCTCDTATCMNASTTPFASLVFSPVFSATDWNTAVCVIAPAFMAFIAFIAGMMGGAMVFGARVTASR